MRTGLTAWAALIAFIAASGCQVVLGIEEVSSPPGDGGACCSDAAVSADDGAAGDAASAQPCSTDPSYQDSPVTGNRYRVYDDGDRRQWMDAEAECQSLGAHLVVIENDAENTALASLITGFAWIGLTDAETEGLFVWVTGEPVTYQAWTPGEPNNASGVEHCAEIYMDGNWNDQTCTDALSFICECETAGAR